ncbi:MAG: DUF4249 domain-containing protein [Bacteroidales bacterium]
MKKYISLLFVASLLSCQKVIDLDLDSTSSRLVIQGNIYDQEGPYKVKLSRSVDFDELSIYPAVSNATVIISDDHGNADTLSESDAGIYETSKIKGIPGYKYDLAVTVDGITYIATSTMPDAISIDSIYTEDVIFGDGTQVGVKFKDPANVSNYYRLIQFINNRQTENFHVISDDLYDGKNIEYSLMTMDDDDELETGDMVAVGLECVDKGVYDYFRTAGSDGNQSASPSNPISNISNGALGYFNACTYRVSSIKIP